ncbi:hypothetical protein ABT174_02040 [Streptomyces sparsogenes]|uniref:hypothetical protein n=1 Tax=Streptomyces sparsogenes TaxID=67365 RepID=UPI00332BB1C7
MAAAYRVVTVPAPLAAVGAIGQGAGRVILTTTLGPTAYVLLAHPRSGRRPDTVAGTDEGGG